MSLTINLYSFGYKFGGIPQNEFGDGGGFVFDCRFLPNPFHDQALKNFTGLDQPIINYFRDKPEMERFVQSCFSLVKEAIVKYQAREFKHLQISFGCTGGKHRSVYCSTLFKELLEKEGYQTTLTHADILK